MPATNPFQNLIVTFAPGERIFSEGEVGATMFIVHSGRARLFQNGKSGSVEVAEMEKGDFFGEMSLLEGTSRHHSAEAIEPTELIEIDSTTFDRMIRGNIEIAVRLLRKLSGRLKKAEAQLASRVQAAPVPQPLTAAKAATAERTPLVETTMSMAAVPAAAASTAPPAAASAAAAPAPVAAAAPAPAAAAAAGSATGISAAASTPSTATVSAPPAATAPMPQSSSAPAPSGAPASTPRTGARPAPTIATSVTGSRPSPPIAVGAGPARAAAGAGAATATAVSTRPAAAADSGPRLVSETGDTIFPIRTQEATLGRYDPVTETQPEVDLTLVDIKRSVSRRHAKIFAKDGGFYLNEEVGALNGTFLNGSKLVTGKPAPLRSGDQISLGTVHLVFKS